MKNILVTGGAGFIGSNFIKLALAEVNDINIINLDALTYAGNLENLKDVELSTNYKFIKGNICDREVVNKIFSSYDIDTVVNFAAESHVDRSITHPSAFVETNIIGCQCLLDCALKSWKTEPEDKYSKKFKDGVKFIQISTDEVYGSDCEGGYFTENTPLAPNSPYSASKASADLLVLSYYKTFGLPVNITRCSNNYGPHQFPEKLIPLMINNCLTSKQLPVYGDGLQVRDWIHVEDHNRAVLKVIFYGLDGEIYNIGGECEKTNLEMVRMIIEKTNANSRLIKHVADRPGHDRRYAIDCRKIKEQLGWRRKWTFEEGIEATVKWYIENKEWMDNVTRGEYREYYRKMYENEHKTI